MILDREQEKLSSLVANTGENFRDYLVIVRRQDGCLSWRSSDSTWAESAARQYVQNFQSMLHFQTLHDFNTREG